MKGIFKSNKLFIGVLIITAFLSNIILTASISGCGVITTLSDSDSGEGWTFAPKDNYERKDIYIDSAGNTEILENSGQLNKSDAENRTSGVLPKNPDNPDNSDKTEKPDPFAEDVTIPDNINDTPGANDTADTTKTGQSQENQETVESVEVPTTPAATAPPPAQNKNTPPGGSNSKDGTVKLSFLAAGDNIMHLNMIHDAQERAKDGEKFNFRDMYAHIEDTIKSYDISMVNVETPIAGDEFAYDGYPMFNTPKENAFALMDIGFSIMNTANNHMLDKWEKGYMNSIEFWESHKTYNGRDILQIGGFKDKDDFETVRIYNKNGVSIAFLSYTYGTNGMKLPDGSKMVIPYLSDVAVIERQIKSARPLADLLFVVMHWGEEDQYIPSASQRSLAQMMVDNGADVIIGMHPHVLQETKWVDRPDGGKTLITYSIGNFISGMLYGKNMVGALLGFDIIKTTKDGNSTVSIENAKIIPIITHYNTNRKRFYIYNLEDYTEDLAKVHGCKVSYSPDFSLKYAKDLIKKNIAPEFLSDFYK